MEIYIWGSRYPLVKDEIITTPLLYDNNVINTNCCGWDNQSYLNKNGEVKLYSYLKPKKVVAKNIERIVKGGFIDTENYFWTYGSLFAKDKAKKLFLTKANFSNVEKFVASDWRESQNSFSVILKDKKIYSWGENSYKTISSEEKDTFQDKIEVQLPAEISEVKEYKINVFNAYILDQNNELWARGNATSSGISTNSSRINEWTKISAIDNIKKVYINHYTIHVLKNDGTVWATGSQVRIGNGSTSSNATQKFIQITRDSAGNNIDFSNLKTITEGGLYHIAALMEDGTVYVWGANDFGKLGTGNTTQSAYPTKLDSNIFPSKVVDVKTMYNNTVFLLENGDVYVTGDNTYGQLGIGNRTSSTVPVRANISDVKEIVTGLNHIIAIKKDDSVWAWGSGTYGQLGTRKSQDELTPVEAYELCK